jgi:ferredoxin
MVEVDIFDLLEQGLVSQPTFHRERCLRFRYYLNRCNLCLKSCPFGAIRESLYLELDEEKCTGCGICWQVCPTEAWAFPKSPEKTLRTTILSLQTSALELICHRAAQGEVFSPAPVALNVKRCLASLSLALILETALSAPQGLWLNDELCPQCPMGSAQSIIREQAQKANRILKAFGKEETVALKSSLPDRDGLLPAQVRQGDEPLLDRRASFSLLYGELAGLMRKAVSESLEGLFGQLLPPEERVPKHLPEPRLRLVRTLARLGTPKDEEIPASELPFGLVEVDDSCTACGLCANQCPTGALIFHRNQESFTIDFVPLACIGCKACEGNCPTGAIKVKPYFSFPALLRSLRLTVFKGELKTCRQCGKPFRPTEGEEICPACRKLYYPPGETPAG